MPRAFLVKSASRPAQPYVRPWADDVERDDGNDENNNDDTVNNYNLIEREDNRVPLPVADSAGRHAVMVTSSSLSTTPPPARCDAAISPARGITRHATPGKSRRGRRPLEALSANAKLGSSCNRSLTTGGDTIGQWSSLFTVRL